MTSVSGVATRIGSDGQLRPLTALKVLYVDDHAVARTLMQAMVQGLGAVPTCVGSADEAIELAETGRFDVVLTDIGLADLNGEQLAAALKRQPGSRFAPVIAVTGQRRPQRLPGVFQDWLQKPYSLRELYACLAAATALRPGAAG